MKKILYILLPLLFAAVTAVATSAGQPAKWGDGKWENVKWEHTSRIEVQRGEKWWGVFVGDSPAQPFAASFTTLSNEGTFTAQVRRPVLLSSNGRIIRSDSTAMIEFDGVAFTISSNGRKVAAEKGGKNLRDAYLVCCHKYFPPRGTGPNAVAMTAPVYETAVELGEAQGQEQVLDYARRILQEGFPAGTIVIPYGWRSPNAPDGDFSLSSELYPDPKAMLDELHGMGFRVVLTVTPYIPAAGRNFAAALRDGLLLTAGASRSMMLPGGSAIAVYDMGNPAVFELYRVGLAEINRRLPFDGYRFDTGPVFPAATALSSEFATVFASAFAQGFSSNWNSNWAKLGEGLPVFEYVYGEKKPFSPYIDSVTAQPGETDALTAAINDVISAGMLGFPYVRVGTDLDFSQIPTSGTSAGSIFGDQGSMADLLRLQACMPVATVDFAPWRIADQAIYQSVKRTFEFRASIADYIADLVAASERTGEPLVRHLEYQFPRSGFADCNDQFMLGPHYMFAPATGQGGKRMVRIPKGTWTDSSGKRHRGPVVIEVDCRSGITPWFHRASGK